MRINIFTGAGRTENNEEAMTWCEAREGLSQVGKMVPLFPGKPGPVEYHCPLRRDRLGRLRRWVGMTLASSRTWEEIQCLLPKTSSWFKRVPRGFPMQDGAADLFYSRLFVVGPEWRELFLSDLRDQKLNLMRMIAMAVRGTNNLDKMMPGVKVLAGAVPAMV